MSPNKTNQKQSKLLIVSAHSSNSFQFTITKTVKIVASTFACLIVLGLGWAGYKYWFYYQNVTAFHQQFEFIMTADDKDLSKEIQVKKALIKIEAFINNSDLFISKAIGTEQEACNQMKLPYSSKEFSDFLLDTRSNRSKAQPASAASDFVSITSDHAAELQSSNNRQQAIEENIQITPTGFPVDGVLKQNKFSKNPGVEIQAPYGTYVKATASGVVTKIEEICQHTFVVEITHRDEDIHKTVSRYLYCYDLSIEKGDSVNKGQVIAKVGYYPGTKESILGYQLLINNLLVEP
jgi:murein DD-endopeptidase MepM/ murein hydrolase activator NlpD